MNTHTPTHIHTIITIKFKIKFHFLGMPSSTWHMNQYESMNQSLPDSLWVLLTPFILFLNCIKSHIFPEYVKGFYVSATVFSSSNYLNMLCFPQPLQVK